MLAHRDTISAIADTASINESGRAPSREISHIEDMSGETWRDRISAAAKRDGRSLRDISLAAGLSHGYLHGILRDSKEPTLDRFARICAALDLSLTYALMGYDVSPETEALISEIEGSPTKRAALLALLAPGDSEA